MTEERAEPLIVRAGKKAWSVLGIVGILIVAWIVVSYLAVVVVPLVLAIIAAAALAPIANMLIRLHVPRAIAAFLAVLALFAFVVGVLYLIIPPFIAKLDDLRQAVSRAIEQLSSFLPTLPFFGPNVDVVALFQRALSQFFSGSSIPAALGTVVTVIGGIVLFVVILLFYLAEGRWLAAGIVSWLPRRRQGEVWKVASELWDIVGRYFRALVIIAIFDALFIGLGLILLGVPLVFPLAVLTFFGAFLPYIGATISGLLAVLVAYVERGLITALLTLMVVLLVQQIEGNVLQPLIMGTIVKLPALLVLLAVAAGAVLLGILGAFLAVPVAASVQHVLEHLARRTRTPPYG